MSARGEVRLQHRIEAFALDRAMAWFAARPIDRASEAGAKLGQAVGPRLSAHRTALNNLTLAFPERSETEREAIAHAMWGNIGRTLGEFAHLPRLKVYDGDGRVEVRGLDILDATKASGKGAVFVSGHLANWEVMAAALVQRGLPVRVAYRAPNNPLVSARIAEVRRGYGLLHQAPKGREGGMSLLRALAKGESVAILNDQKYGEGLAAPLFGHAAMTGDGPARLALRFDAPIIPMAVRRLEGARFEVAIHPPIAFDRSAPADEAALEATVRLNAYLEARIREAPEQWFWVHRRWPKEAWAAAAARARDHTLV